MKKLLLSLGLLITSSSVLANPSDYDVAETAKMYIDEVKNQL